MTQEPNFDIAYAIAAQLSSERTDHNELAKASTYLNQAQDPDDFFTWLEWMAAPRVSEALARSNRTPVYYQQIRHACRQLKTMPYPAGASADDKRAIMAQTLAWAVRLMRYMPVAKPVAGADSLRFNQSGATTAKAPATAAGTTSRQPHSIRDLQRGMQLTGTVKRTAPFGAFVDVGVGRDGLVHVSKLRQGYVKEVESVIKQGESVTVWVEEVDAKQGRISLTMIAPTAANPTVATAPRSTTGKATPAPRTQGRQGSEITWCEAPSPPESSTAQSTQPIALTAPRTSDQPTDTPPVATGATPEKSIAPPLVIPATPPVPEAAALADKPAPITLTAPEQVMVGLSVKGTVQRVETNRLVVNIGLAEAATLTFVRLPGSPKDPNEVAQQWPAGSELVVRIVRINEHGRVQLALADL